MLKCILTPSSNPSPKIAAISKSVCCFAPLHLNFEVIVCSLKAERLYSCFGFVLERTAVMAHVRDVKLCIHIGESRREKPLTHFYVIGECPCAFSRPERRGMRFENDGVKPLPPLFDVVPRFIEKVAGIDGIKE